MTGHGRILGLYAAAYLVFLYLPVLLIPVFSVNDSATPRFPLAGFTTQWYGDLLTNRVMHGAALNSLLVGGATAVIATLLGIGAARAVTRYRFPGRGAGLGLIMTPLYLPEIIVAVALLILFLGLGLPLSLVTVTLAHVLVALPYSMTVLVAGFEGFDRTLEEASADLGETKWGTFTRVTLPMLAPAVVSSLLVAFTISLDEFILAFFLSGTEPTLPVYIWGQLRFAAKLPSVLALGSVLIACSIILLVVSEIFRRRAEVRLAPAGGIAV